MKSIVYNLQPSLALIIAFNLALLGCRPATQSQQRRSPTPPLAAATPTPGVHPVKTPAARLDVPYVPTPTQVVDKMLEMAKVTKNDLLYDLGSGDGRIVITAAKRYGARGVGYDLNPRRIQESNENARQAGVTDRVRFVQEDLFKADLSGATVVTLYLLPEVNIRLQPKLLRELRPGTRVVSHNYGMENWEPEKVVGMEINGTMHYIYLWVIARRRR